jgi:hypothetical protein
MPTAICLAFDCETKRRWLGSDAFTVHAGFRLILPQHALLGYARTASNSSRVLQQRHGGFTGPNPRDIERQTGMVANCQGRTSPRTAIMSDSYSAISAFHSTLIRAAKNVNAVHAIPSCAKNSFAAGGRAIFFGRPLDPVLPNGGGWFGVTRVKRRRDGVDGSPPAHLPHTVLPNFHFTPHSIISASTFNKSDICSRLFIHFRLSINVFQYQVTMIERGWRCSVGRPRLRDQDVGRV